MSLKYEPASGTLHVPDGCLHYAGVCSNDADECFHNAQKPTVAIPGHPVPTVALHVRSVCVHETGSCLLQGYLAHKKRPPPRTIHHYA